MASKKKSSKVPANKRSKAPDLTTSELVEVRNSAIHGSGVYAVTPIKKGTRIYEYVGERITNAEADRRYALKDGDDGHTFLFVVNHKTVIDGTNGGNDARYINHRCDANCETVTEGNRIFIEAIRDIKKGEELGYDYQLTWSDDDDPKDLALYNCRCGAKNCRGTMLDKYSLEQNRARDRAKRKRALARKAAQKTMTKAAKKSVKKTTKKTLTKPVSKQAAKSLGKGKALVKKTAAKSKRGVKQGAAR